MEGSLFHTCVTPIRLVFSLKMLPVCPHLAIINRGETRTLCTGPTVFKYLLPSNRQTATDCEDRKSTIITSRWRRLSRIPIRVQLLHFDRVVALLQKPQISPPSGFIGKLGPSTASSASPTSSHLPPRPAA